MNNTTINELNTFLKGEYMAVDGYEKYIQKISDANIKSELQRIQQDHKQHAIKIAERIQNLGGRPAGGVGIAGKTAQIMSDIKDMGLKETKAVLKQAYNGENNGIKMADEVVKGDLDNESRNLINDILDSDKGHLQKLSSLINGNGAIKQ